MAERTEIAWCDSTFNPWIGCTKVSPGCDHCYAEADFDLRKHRVKWGAGQERSRTGAANWKKPEAWEKAHAEFFAAHGRRQRVFCASLADVFDNEVPVQWRADLFALIAATPNLDWLLLTKRIGNARTMMADALHLVPAANRDGMIWPLPNVWLGATIVNQEEADRDIPKLLATPARVRFVSMEPLLAPVDIRWSFSDAGVLCCPKCGFRTNRHNHGPCPNDGATLRSDIGIDWVIVGGESGPGARPIHPEWARTLRDQCAAAGVPFLFKQVGEAVPVDTEVDCDHGQTVYPLDGELTLPGERYRLHEHGGIQFVRVPKKASGRLLDGVTHDGFPTGLAA